MFYDNLKNECDRQKLKVTPLIQECGGSTGTISNWKRGASPNSDIVMRLAMRLNVSTDYLLFGKSNISFCTEETAKEKKLLDIFRQLNENGQENVMNFANFTFDDDRYKKFKDIPKQA